jgi:hypothetical protein
VLVSNAEGGDSCTARQPLAVTDQGVVQESRQGLEEKAGAPLIMERFRPNVVVSDAPAWAEDLWSEVAIGGPKGSVTLKLVKPCSRCSIPDVDPTTGTASPCACHLPTTIDSLGFHNCIRSHALEQTPGLSSLPAKHLPSAPCQVTSLTCGKFCEVRL